LINSFIQLSLGICYLLILIFLASKNKKLGTKNIFVITIKCFFTVENTFLRTISEKLVTKNIFFVAKNMFLAIINRFVAAKNV